jgi:hypothetical protein
MHLSNVLSFTSAPASRTTRRWLALIVVGGTSMACASLTSPPDPALALELTAILPGEAPACADGDASCCEALAGRMKLASERGDDEDADRDAERLALACPGYRPHLLSPGHGVPIYRPAQMTPTATYKVRLGARDHLTWAAVYVDGARLGNGDLPASGEVTATFHVVAGEGAERGRTFVVSSRQPIAPIAPWKQTFTVTLTRVSGMPPFEVRVKTELRDFEEGAGGGDGAAMELAARVRPFEPPVELREAGAPGVVFSVCPKGAGHPHIFHIQPFLAAPHLHPRHLAAVLEWLRRLSYEAPRYLVWDHWKFDFQTRIDPPHGLRNLLTKR